MLKAAVAAAAHTLRSRSSHQIRFVVLEQKTGGECWSVCTTPVRLWLQPANAFTLMKFLNSWRTIGYSDPSFDYKVESMSLQLFQEFTNWIHTTWNTCKLRKGLQRYATLNHAVKLMGWCSERQLMQQPLCLPQISSFFFRTSLYRIW